MHYVQCSLCKFMFYHWNEARIDEKKRLKWGYNWPDFCLVPIDSGDGDWQPFESRLKQL